ncbi:hypothetical protein B0T10DRAFT_201702 [Thelonectria olida]|uniref:C2H2-type domain-containing protein n=1 Tax=Thelonectria olida TaxID=1576542 RepID=A0A9P8VVS5_9HYPO|nr:hypothetical protein B0T10DRAFT_201702 [Thelonectria olida]
MGHRYDPNANYGYWYEATSPQEQAASPSVYPFEYHQAQPLARYASSGGSSQASSIPDSPLSLRATHDPSMESFHQRNAYATSPQTIMEESSAVENEGAYSGRDWPVFCLSPGCNARPFKRCADLQRHYRNTHAPVSLKDSYLCDYPRCTRARDPFHRRDHFRDHLREYHREDIQKRGNTVNEEWLEGRYLPTTWWRCPRCLVRVYISKSGFECPGCKTSCESKRKERRRRGT